MSKRMLIEGTHAEEIRVVVTDGNRLEDYDVETSTKRQLKGNIYLAKVTRVEPSLQAAFVDYGGNRHGFLAFNEIHPDYYQIPIEDREALLAEDSDLDLKATAAQAHVDEIDGEVNESDESDDQPEFQPDASDDQPEDGDQPSDGSADGPSDETAESAADQPNDHESQSAAEDTDAPEAPSDGGADDDAGDEAAAAKDSDRRRARFMRRYRIQEVIKRRQILLVQVVKEERGNKGAALTSYISLAGRYCVLMPNTGRGGGISRKVTNAASRRKMRDILNDLEIPEGMGVIMRTAGMERNKTEIKRDFEYLIRAWDNIRELTLQSTAPTLIYEEANLIKRAIRDLYTKEMDEVWVEGNEPYQTAKKFMRLMMPSHAKRVQPYRDEAIPLFHRYQVESQLDAMLDPTVQLKSGGYIVIHSTEALVAIDVNSGRSTKERNIEETALKTNIEAAEEIARQLRLRDLAGLIVIDFIDMEVSRNPRKVEKVLKDAMATDRARIQFGRISAFGLLELSRQRLRPSLQETSTQVCPHCEGVGYIRSTESMAVRVLRALIDEGIRNRSSEVTVAVPTSVALYILNRKRDALVDIEKRYGFHVLIEGNDTLPASEFELERVKGRAPGSETATDVINMDAVVSAVDADTAAAAAQRDAQADADDEAVSDDDVDAEVSEVAADEATTKRPRRRRRGRKAAASSDAETVSADEAADASAELATQADDQGTEGEGDERAPSKRRRRGKRGGRRRTRRDGQNGVSATPHEDAIAATFAWAREEPVAVSPEAVDDPDQEAAGSTFDRAEQAEESPGDEVGSHNGTGDAVLPETDVASDAIASPNGDTAETDRDDEAADANGELSSAAQNGPTSEQADDEPSDAQSMSPEISQDQPKRRGWWQRMID